MKLPGPKSLDVKLLSPKKQRRKKGKVVGPKKSILLIFAYVNLLMNLGRKNWYKKIENIISKIRLFTFGKYSRPSHFSDSKFMCTASSQTEHL